MKRILLLAALAACAAFSLSGTADAHFGLRIGLGGWGGGCGLGGYHGHSYYSGGYGLFGGSRYVNYGVGYGGYYGPSVSYYSPGFGSYYSSGYGGVYSSGCSVWPSYNYVPRTRVYYSRPVYPYYGG
ncbi:MAG: hypothetical protein KDA41_19610, partial [Planctomycetales bacterium]|nr:hypothetical protein [Planctomycetales bacterium]